MLSLRTEGSGVVRSLINLELILQCGTRRVPGPFHLPYSDLLIQRCS